MFADAVYNDFFSEEQMNGTDTLAVQNLSTIYLENDHNKAFNVKALPLEAQYAPVNAITVTDINNDGNKDLILAGNTLFTRIKFSRYDANRGIHFMDAIDNGLIQGRKVGQTVLSKFFRKFDITGN